MVEFIVGLWVCLQTEDLDWCWGVGEESREEDEQAVQPRGPRLRVPTPLR